MDKTMGKYTRQWKKEWFSCIYKYIQYSLCVPAGVCFVDFRLKTGSTVIVVIVVSDLTTR